MSKGTKALRAARAYEAQAAAAGETPESTARKLLGAAAAAERIVIPSIAITTKGLQLSVHFGGDHKLEMRTDIGDWRTWSLWIRGNRVGLFGGANTALAFANGSGWLPRTR